MHRFDYSFLKNDIPSDIFGAISILYDLRGRNEMRIEEKSSTVDSMRKNAMVDSVRSSNAIEGIVSTKERVAEIMENGGPKTHDEKEIDGYRKALTEVCNNYDIQLTEDLLKHWHYLMLEFTSEKAGEYKTEDNWIQQRDRDGNVSVRFVPVRAKDTEDAMSQLFTAYREARQDSDILDLFAAFAFVLDFLCIHPFADGNGRVSRLLTDMLLLKMGFTVGLYVSVDKKIEDNLAEYYDALYRSSEGWHQNKNDYMPFILYMIRIVYECYKDFDKRFIKASITPISKEEQIANYMENAFVPVSKNEIMDAFPEISEITVKRTLKKLADEGRIVKIGTYRDARYKHKF